MDYYTATELRCLPTNYLSTRKSSAAPNKQGAARDGDVEPRRINWFCLDSEGWRSTKKVHHMLPSREILSSSLQFKDILKIFYSWIALKGGFSEEASSVFLMGFWALRILHDQGKEQCPAQDFNRQREINKKLRSVVKLKMTSWFVSSRLLQISWCKDVSILHKDTVIIQGSVDLAFTVVWL